MLRDEKGDVRAAYVFVLPYIRDPTMAEAVALWKAVLLCGDLGYQRVIFEGDSKQVVQNICRAQPWNLYDQLLEDMRTRLQGLQYHEVVHVSRKANKVAHGLAKLALNRSTDYVWIDECPSSIIPLIIADQGFSE